MYFFIVYLKTKKACLKYPCPGRMSPFSSPEAALLLVSTKNRDLWPSPTPEVRDSRTSRHSAHVQSQVWQIWLVVISIYCVYKAIQKRNVVELGQRSRFLVLTKRSAASGDENGMSLNFKVLAINTFQLIQHWITSGSSYHGYSHAIKIRPYQGLRDDHHGYPKKFIEFRILIRDHQLFIDL